MQYKFAVLLTSVLLALEVSASKSEKATPACGTTLSLNYHTAGDKAHNNKNFIHAASTSNTDWKTASSKTKSAAVKQYDAEHVFEAQTIGNFFSQWLVNGNVFGTKLGNHLPAGVKVTKKRDCAWVQANAFNPNKWNTALLTASPATAPGTAQTAFTPPQKFGPIRLPAAQEPLAMTVYNELGSESKPDIMLKYDHLPNDAKGRLFRGADTVSRTSYKSATPKVKLDKVKEMALNFHYLNSAEAVKLYCITYENARKAFVEFDTVYNKFYKANDQDASNLADEWKAYNRAVLYSIVENARLELRVMYTNRKAGKTALTAAQEAEWKSIRTKVKEIHLNNLKCTNLDAAGNAAGKDLPEDSTKTTSTTTGATKRPATADPSGGPTTKKQNTGTTTTKAATPATNTSAATKPATTAAPTKPATTAAPTKPATTPKQTPKPTKKKNGRRWVA